MIVPTFASTLTMKDALSWTPAAIVILVGIFHNAALANMDREKFSAAPPEDRRVSRNFPVARYLTPKGVRCLKVRNLLLAAYALNIVILWVI